MTRLRSLALLLLFALPLMSVQAQGVPPQLTPVLNALSTRLNRPLTVRDLDSWTFEQTIYTDSALGCPYVTGVPIPQGISGFTFALVYQGVSYDYRVAADDSILFACEPPPAAASPTAPPSANNCPPDFAGYLPPRLKAGGQARISPGGLPNRLRALPSVNAKQIGLIQPGATVSILDGPFCEGQSHIIWWRVSDNGTVGWTAEGQPPSDYFLSPMDSGGGTLSAERNLITANNANSLDTLSTLAVPGVNSISLTADGVLAAFGGLSGLSVYNLSTLQLNTHLSDPTAPVSQVAFSPDGRYLAYSTTNNSTTNNSITNNLIVYDTTASAPVTLNGVQTTAIQALSFSPDARHLLATGSGDPAKTPGIISAWQVYDVPNGQQLLSLPTPTWVRSVAFSPDGTLFAWVDTALHVVKAADGSTVMTLPLQAPLRGLAWRPGASHAVAFADAGQIRLVDLDAKTEQRFSGDPGFFADALAFSPDGSLLAAMNVPDNTATASTVNIFNPDTAALIASTPLQPSKALVFTPDGTLLLVAANDQVLLLGAPTAAPAIG